MNISTHSALHRGFKNFASFVSPSSEKQKDASEHAQTVIDSIRAEAERQGCKVEFTRISGSLAKGTGLRRHLHGDGKEEGQDIDLAFVLKPEKDSAGKLVMQIDNFVKYALACYPASDPQPTKSSVSIKFKTSKLSYDLVPLYSTGLDDRQILVRCDNEIRTTSLNRHVEFVHKRVAKSDLEYGVVKFSQMIRLFKWWRTVQQSDPNSYFDNKAKKIASFLIDLLCAKAFDIHSVQDTYPATLATWFGYLEEVVRKRQSVVFTDHYGKWEQKEGALWTVLDPVDKENNVVGNAQKWTNRGINELADWLGNAHDSMNRAMRLDSQGRYNEALTEMVKLFGNAFKNHSEEEL